MLRRKIIIGAIIFLLCATAALAAGLAWRHFSQRQSLPFSLDAGPVVGRRIYSMASDELPPPADAPRLHDWQVIGDPVSVPADLAAELREVLSSPSTYLMSESQCFEPGAAFSFGQGSDRVDVLICLLCNRAMFYRGDVQVGRRISGEGNKRLTSIYQRLFKSEPPNP